MRETDHHVRHDRTGCGAGVGQSWKSRVALVSSVSLLSAIVAWSYGGVIASLCRGWQSNADYSAGQLVPLVAVFLIWRDRTQLKACPFMPDWWGGLALLLLALAGRTYGLVFMFQSLQRYTLVLTIAGLVLLVAGRQVFRRVVWVLLLLFLMVPLPGRVHNMIAGPLQRLATAGSVVLLEVIGASVSQQGNVVMLSDDTPMAVAEACSGLRMLTAFIIVAAFIACMVRRPRWQKAVLLASSIPVAVICNIVRIFATAVLMILVSSEVGEKFFHDFAGIVMMPAAVLLLFGELWLMEKIVVTDSAAPPAAKPLTIRRSRPPRGLSVRSSHLSDRPSV